MKERLQELEIKVTYQEQTIEDLNQVVLQLREEVGELSKIVKQLTQQIDTGIKDQKDETPPPHY